MMLLTEPDEAPLSLGPVSTPGASTERLAVK